MPYPGTMMTDRAFSNTAAASSIVPSVTRPPAVVITSWVTDAEPNPANRTLASERFMARHMMLVRINPDAPTSEPEMMSTLLESTNPAVAPAMPEYEFNRAMTTGMSAPPIGMTESTPRISARMLSTMNRPDAGGATMTYTESPIAISSRTRLSQCCPLNRIGRPGMISWSFAKAMTLPVNVTPPTIVDSGMAISAARGTCPPLRYTSTATTSSEAPPPKPLYSATI